mgnify:CR=1 FL=1
MKIHVICCNDSVQGAVIENEARAVERMEQLALDDFKRNHWHWEDEAKKFGQKGKTPYEHYRSRLYWHIHTVEGE